ncbi:hypothetical protein KC19_N011300 [Ceratodon purpureus]|nr:hypothetical protein KC19_N011300 [Ceratodon purpureus]KAG0504627.1 hypothetical protein KC19_N011300 [Ceratodon purpureus]KAG0504628.1 hypothetical protein KC19_N011300 [Ceratodon purpureus]
MESVVYTLDDCLKHRDKEDCWIIIDGKVYDVSEFLEEHPGGDDVILLATGKDATDDFEDVGHSAGARELMKKYLIGDMDVTTLPVEESDEKTPQILPNKGSPSEMLITVLQFLIPLTFLALAIAVRYLTSDTKGASSS